MAEKKFKMGKAIAEPNSIGEVALKAGGAAAAALASYGVAKFLEWNDKRREEKKAKKEQEKKEQAKKELSEEEILALATVILEKREAEKAKAEETKEVEG